MVDYFAVSDDIVRFDSRFNFISMVTIDDVMEAEEKLLPCPLCGENVFIKIFDEEGNIRDEDYLDDPWSGLTFGISHPYKDISSDDDCVLMHWEEEHIGNLYYDLNGLVEKWNTRIDSNMK